MEHAGNRESGTPFIQAEGLSKTYIRRQAPKDGGISRLWRRETKEVHALQDATFSIARGELLGLIGPNGAGKSTTVKMLTGILTPTAGTCTVDGRVPWLERKEHVRHLGAVFGQRMQLWWDVPICESFDLLRDIYGVEQGRYRQRLDELVTALDLGEILHSPLRQLSLGQRMRAELCGSLLHEPSLLFLDEPTIGLDAVSKLKLRSFLKEENEKRHTTILLTTHDMEDMLALCNRVMVLGRGQLLYDGALDALMHRYDTAHTLKVKFHCEPDVHLLPDGVVKDGDEWCILLDKSVDLSQTMQQMTSAGKLREMRVEEQNVDELIARMYKEMSL